MDVKFGNQGSSLLNQMQKLNQVFAEKTKSLSNAPAKKEDKANNLPSNVTDKLDLSSLGNVSKQLAVSKEDESQKSNSTSGEIQASDGTKVSFQFDLFYQLTSKVEAKMGSSGAERFVNLSASVAETFQSSFSLSIDGVGSFMNGTDKSLNISPETANEFFDAVEGLTKQGPEALQNFLEKSDAFFNELEANYGSADGAFDTIKEQVQAQAKEFLSSVGDAQQFVLGDNAQNALSGDFSSLLEQAGAAFGELGAPTEEEGKDSGNNLIKMTAKPNISATQEEYQDFLKKFLEYANQVKQSMFDDLMSLKDKTASSSSTTDALKSLLDVSA